MDLSLPWTPSLNNIVLPSCGRYQSFVSEGAKPNSRSNPGWDEGSIKNIVANVPQAAGVVCETVLALWRLQMVEPEEDETDEDELWRQHATAWLVSVGDSRTCGD